MEGKALRGDLSLFIPRWLPHAHNHPLPARLLSIHLMPRAHLFLYHHLHTRLPMLALLLPLQHITLFVRRGLRRATWRAPTWARAQVPSTLPTFLPAAGSTVPPLCISLYCGRTQHFTHGIHSSLLHLQRGGSHPSLPLPLHLPHTAYYCLLLHMHFFLHYFYHYFCTQLHFDTTGHLHAPYTPPCPCAYPSAAAKDKAHGHLCCTQLPGRCCLSRCDITFYYSLCFLHCALSLSCATPQMSLLGCTLLLNILHACWATVIHVAEEGGRRLKEAGRLVDLGRRRVTHTA